MSPAISRHLLLVALAGFTGAAIAAEPAPAGASSVSIHATIADPVKKPETPPFFHGAAIGETVVVREDAALVTARVEVRIVQGEPEVIPIALSGDGEIATVSGNQLLDWAVRTDASGRRFLDLRPKPGLKAGDTFTADVAAKTDLAKSRHGFSPLLFLSSAAVSSELSLRVVAAEGVDVSVRGVEGLVALTSAGPREKLYRARGEAKLTLSALRSGEAADPVTLENFRLAGDLAGDHAGFTLETTARVREAGASCVILSGGAAMREAPEIAGCRVALATGPDGRPQYRLEFDKPGDYALKLAFDARVVVAGDRRSVDFAVPAAQVAPYALSGCEPGVKFESSGAPAPLADGKDFAGHLPPGGGMNLSWIAATKAEADARLFFSTDERTEVSVGAGLLERTSSYTVRVLQGKLDALTFDLAGEGEVMRVSGEDILAWTVEAGDKPGARRLVVKLSRPRTGDYRVTIAAQNALKAFPASFSPLSVSPRGAVRHGGLLRVANSGAVRLEVAPGRSLTQVSPSSFPGGATARASQAFVYRVSSADAAYTVHADDIMPEIAVSQVTVCTLGERDETLSAELDVEVREAPLRELVLKVPSGYAVASVVAPDLADHNLSAGELRLAFAKPVTGRVLVKVRLEKNLTEAPASWTPPAIGFPGAKSVRGFIGVCAAPGLRLTPGESAGLSEIAAAFFPGVKTGLQQAWRVREPNWSATMKVEKLGVAVQADVLHQYAVREGSVAESTLVNYVIVGAPVQTLRFKIPKGATNLEFAGGEIRGWKTEGDVAEVSLRRGVTGAFTLMASCELPLNARGGESDLSGIRPLGAQSEQGHILVTSDQPFGVAPKEVSKNLSTIEPGEIPPEYRMIADAPLLASYQYTGGEYALRLAFTPRGVGKTVSQIVDLASLETKVSREGGCVTVCRYLVKSRGTRHLRLRVPAELRLWTARVNDREVVPVKEGDDTLVPLPPTEGPDTVTTVELRVAQNGAGGVVVHPATPALLAPVVRTAWTFTPDAGRSLVNTGGDMAQISGPAAKDGLSDLSGHLRTRRGVAAAIVVAALAGFGLGALRLAGREGRGSKLWKAAGLVSVLAAAGGLACGALKLVENARRAGVLKFSSAILEPGSTPVLKLVNLPDYGFAPSAFGLGALALGATLIVGGAVRRRPALRAAGWGAVLAAPLFMPGGLPLALGAGALFAVVGIALPALRSRKAISNTAALLVVAAIVGAPNRAEAKDVAVQPMEMAQANDVRPIFKGRKWAWYANEGINGPFGTLEFLENGRCRFTGDVAGWLAGWEPLGYGKIKVKHNDGRYWIFVYKPEVDEAESIAGQGSVDAGKILRPLSAQVGRATAADSIRQKIRLSDDRAEGEGVIRVTGRAGDRFDLLASPAVLTSCKPPEGVRLAHREANGVTVAQLVLDRDGSFSVAFAYRLALTPESSAFALPTGRAVADSAVVSSAKGDLVFTGGGVVSVRPDAGASGSSATLVFAPENVRSVAFAPKTRDARDEKLVFYSEVANLFTPAPGVIEGRHVVRIRPAQGVTKDLTVEVPEGLTVSEVTGAAVGSWRYDPESRLLHVSTESARSTPFEFVVGTQAATGALPADFRLAPLVVRGSSGRTGLVGLASGEEVRFESVKPEGLSPVSTDDFPAPDGAKVVVRRAFRHGDGAAAVSVRLSAVEAEVRVKSRQTVSAGDDRVTLNAVITAEILRAGLFKLSFVAPEGMDVESVGGPALAHWAESKEGGKRVVVMHLSGRTLGEQNFTVALSGPGLAGKTAWTPPKLVLNEASRTDGEVLIVPEEGLRLHPTERDGVTQTDPGNGAKKGAMSFRLLDSGYKLAFSVENAAPWIKCDWLQDMTVLDGRVRGSVRFDYTIESAAVRSLRVRLPENAEGVRFTGSLIADAAPVAGSPGIWEVKLQRRVLGKVEFDATFRLPGIEPGKPDTLKSAGPVDAGLRRGWLSLRTGGRLSLRPGEPPETLRAAEWAGVPAALRRGFDEATRTLRVMDSEFSLPLAVTTHDPAKMLPVRVKSAEVTSALAVDGRALSSCRLELSLTDKRPLRFTLPRGAGLWQVFVNNRTVAAALDDGALIIPVEPNPAEGSPATVELFYDSPAGAKMAAPSFDLPLENVTWRVSLPDGMRLAGWSGQFVRREDLEGAGRDPSGWSRGSSGSYDTKEYNDINDSRVLASKKNADDLIKLGNKYRLEGNQEQAKNALSLAQSLSKADAALNEDARVQYGNLRAEQIEYGLNRRRAQVLQDNGGMQQQADPKQTLAFSTLSNATTNFTAEEARQLRDLNDNESGAALRKLAERIAGLQQAGTATPEGIRTLLPAGVRTAIFTKALHDGVGGVPLELSVSLSDTRRTGVFTRGIALFAAMLAVAGLARVMKRKA